MVHLQLLALQNSGFPLFALPLIALAGLGLAIFMLVKRGDRWAALMFLGLAGLTASLTWGVYRLEQPATAPFTWPRDLRPHLRKIVGPPHTQGREQFVLAGFVLSAVLTYIGFDRQGQPGFGARQTKRVGEQTMLGASELCPPAIFKRNWPKADPRGMTLTGKYWGQDHKLLGTQLHLSGEDLARGLAAIGGQGSGKTQAVILPTIAARMLNQHSLVVTDVQGELLPYILQIAGLTEHQVIVHNPSNLRQSATYNIIDGIHSITDAQAIAKILLSADNPDDFWATSATNLLSACLLHYPNVGEIMAATTTPQQMAQDLLASENPGIIAQATAFTNSILSDSPKLAHNILATMTNQALSAWADPEIRAVTAQSQFSLPTLGATPQVLVLRCSRRHQETLGRYLGAILSVLVTELDSYGETQPGGILPIPVGLILEEFPTLGRLDSLVNSINVIRKRGISVLAAAQTLAQFHGLYGREGSETLLAGMATKVVFGGCDKVTAEFFSEISGQTTVATASLSEHGDGASRSISASVRGRALLMIDDLIKPPIRDFAPGSGTLFASAAGQQQIMHTQLRMFWQWRDIQKKLQKVTPAEPLIAPPATLSTTTSPHPPSTPIAPPSPDTTSLHDLEPKQERDRDLPGKFSKIST